MIPLPLVLPVFRPAVGGIEGAMTTTLLITSIISNSTATKGSSNRFSPNWLFLSWEAHCKKGVTRCMFPRMCVYGVWEEIWLSPRVFGFYTEGTKETEGVSSNGFITNAAKMYSFHILISNFVDLSETVSLWAIFLAFLWAKFHTLFK